MQYKIQSLVLPTDEKHLACRKLFYRGDHAILDRENETLTLGYAQRCDFVTYLNACSFQKWQKYTNAKKATLHLTITGEAEFLFLGYHKTALNVDRREFKTKKFSAKKKTEVTFEFPENDEQMIGFEVTALSTEFTIHSGYYTVEIPEKSINDITLSVATTTCKKEDFIRKNVSLIKEQIISTKDEMSENFYLHVVDNGRTLTEKEIGGSHVFLHPNINSGGSGGFARGMMESLRQDPKVTHVLLMDDDVLILPESLRRTYNLLKLLKPEYKDHFISGAMLYYEDPSRQHEDVGVVDDNCSFQDLKRVFNHEKLSENLENEGEYITHRNAYAAWWYCCIPRQKIEENGLPLPFFIRCDDMEYSLRAKADFITMNGICVWHMGFITKYNATFDIYQLYRNWLIAKSTSNVLQNVNIMGALWSSFRVEMLRFNYNAAELVVMSLEDYLKGPDFIMNNDGEKITLGNFRLNDKPIPLSELEGGNTVRLENVLVDQPRKLRDAALMKLTWNGQRLTPKFLERPGVVAMGFNTVMQPQKITMHSKLIAVNPYNRTGVYRIKDKQRFQNLMKRYKAAKREFDEREAEIAAEYRAKSKEMTSEKFWIKYLGLEND